MHAPKIDFSFCVSQNIQVCRRGTPNFVLVRSSVLRESLYSFGSVFVGKGFGGVVITEKFLSVPFLKTVENSENRLH